MSVVTRPVPPALAPFVESIRYSEREAPPGLERVFPVGHGMHLHINLSEDQFHMYGQAGTAVASFSGSTVEGPHGRYAIIDNHQLRSAVSMGFRIGSSLALFGIPAADACDQVVELEDLWGRNGRSLRERLLEATTAAGRLRTVEQVLLARLSTEEGPDPAIGSAVRLLDHGARVAEVADSLGWLPTTLRRRFREQVGLTPKRYARVRRLQRLVADVHQQSSVDWAEVAVTHGYYDQAHLVHDFRELTGITPTAYAANQTAQRNHVVEEVSVPETSIFTIRRDDRAVVSAQPMVST